MKRFICPILLLLLASAISSHGEAPETEFRVGCDGIIHGSPLLGRTMWSGTIRVKHPRFLLEAEGQASLFKGPSLSRKQAPSGGSLAKDLTIESEWISFVALGDIKITVIEPDANPPPISARRFVYIPDKNQILIDGKPWRSKTRATGTMPSH